MKANKKSDKLSFDDVDDYSIEDKIKLTQLQQDFEKDTIWREKTENIKTQRWVCLIISSGSMLALILSIFFNNTAVTQTAEAIICTLIGYLAGRHFQ